MAEHGRQRARGQELEVAVLSIYRITADEQASQQLDTCGRNNSFVCIVRSDWEHRVSGNVHKRVAVATLIDGDWIRRDEAVSVSQLDHHLDSDEPYSQDI